MFKYDDHMIVKPGGDGSSLDVRHRRRIEVVLTVDDKESWDKDCVGKLQLFKMLDSLI